MVQLGIVLFFIAFPRTSFALVPPDILFSVGSQVVQMVSIGALIFAGVCSSAVLVLRRRLAITSVHAWMSIAGVCLLMAAVVCVVFVRETQRLDALYQEHIVSLQEKLAFQQEEAARLTRQFYATVDASQIAIYGTSSEAYPDSPRTTGRMYFSDTIVLYSPEPDSNITLEMNLNRKEHTHGVYDHYYFVRGLIAGNVVDYYNHKLATSTEPIVHGPLRSYSRTGWQDLSTRSSYAVALDINGTPIEFEVQGLVGDFVTRDSPTYVRLQSTGVAQGTYGGVPFEMPALVQRTFSFDYSQSIFFEGHRDVDATTYQFILWDSQHNFYMIDKSDVRTDTPAYRSHSWLLHKNVATGEAQKSFVTDIVEGADMRSWTVHVPEFSSSTMQLELERTFNDYHNGRSTQVVRGTITDTDGTRDIGGIMHHTQ